MKNSLNLRQANIQTLAMTPQLQQAIRLLQLSSVELAVEIQENLEKNPLLEIDETNNISPIESFEAMVQNENAQNKYDSDDDYHSNYDLPHEDLTPLTNNINSSDSISHNDSTTRDSDMPNSSDPWSENNINGASVSKSSFDIDDEMYQGETSYDLKDHLMWQLNLTPCTEKDKFIATVIIDAINDSGYVSESIEEIISAVKLEYEEVTEDEIEVVFKLLQHFDPIGVACRNIKESLLIQLEQYNKDDKSVQIAGEIISNYLEILGNKDFKTLAKKLNVKDEALLKEAVDTIKSLEPRPGNCIISKKNEFIIPDVAVVKKEGKWGAELNPASVPKLQINQTYAELCKTVTNASDSKYIKGQMQEATWFIQSLNKRNETLLKVANCIVKYQEEFFEKGAHAMKPMVLSDISSEVEMHESTISRVTTEKYMHTPRGTFELKYFFSSHVNTENGGTFSSTAIRALIKELISSEPKNKPYSDSQLSEMLNTKGIIVARRTVAKYRESLNIPPSSQRKGI